MPEVRIKNTRVDLEQSVRDQIAKWYEYNCNEKIVEIKVWMFTFNVKLSALKGVFEKLCGRKLTCR